MMGKDFADGDEVILTGGINQCIGMYAFSSQKAILGLVGEAATLERGGYGLPTVNLEFFNGAKLAVLNHWDCLEFYTDESWLNDGDVLSLLC